MEEKYEKTPSRKEKIIVISILLILFLAITITIIIVVKHFSKEEPKPVVEDITTIDLESSNGKELINKIGDKYGQKIYFLSEDKVVDFSTLSKIEKICLGIKASDIDVTIDEKNYKGYTESQILSNLKELFGIEMKIDPLEKLGKTLMYQEICPSDTLAYSIDNAAYYAKNVTSTEPFPSVLSKIVRIERKDNNLIVYGNAIFRDSTGIVYKSLDDKFVIAEFELDNNGTTFKEYSKDNQTFDYYLKNSYQYIFTFTDDENLHWIGYERSEQ